MDTYLITGSAGFIGYYLAKILLSKGYHVIGVDNLNDYYDVKLKKDRLDNLKDYENFNFFKGDIADKGFLDNLFNQFKFTYVVNLAAQAGVRYSIENPDAYINSNVLGFYRSEEHTSELQSRP